jgi:phospholipid/cholesterol/gamma-HCH transport system substrate-binding protein
MSKIPGRRISGTFLIGLFVIISGLVLVGTVIWLGANKFFKENTYFVTYFEGSVEGLETGSPVKYQGVPVGSISNIAVAPDGKLVQVTMQIDAVININDSLRVKSEFAGIAGGKFLQLHYPNEKLFYAMHPKLNFVPPHKLIKSAPSGFDEIEIAAKDLMGNLMQFKTGEISDEIIGFLSSSTKFMNNKEIYEMISSLNTSSAHFQNILGRADSSSIISNLNATTFKLLETSDKMVLFTELLNQKIKDLEIQSRIDHAIGKYDSLIYSIQHVVNNLGYQAGSVMLNVNETLEQFKSTNKELKKSLRAISDNPSQIFLSNPPEKEK